MHRKLVFLFIVIITGLCISGCIASHETMLAVPDRLIASHEYGLYQTADVSFRTEELMFRDSDVVYIMNEETRNSLITVVHNGRWKMEREMMVLTFMPGKRTRTDKNDRDSRSEKKEKGFTLMLKWNRELGGYISPQEEMFLRHNLFIIDKKGHSYMTDEDQMVIEKGKRGEKYFISGYYHRE